MPLLQPEGLFSLPESRGGEKGENRFQMASCSSVTAARGAASACNDQTDTQMARLRTPRSVVASGLNGCREGLRVRAIRRLLGASHSTILRWGKPLARQADAWFAPDRADQAVRLKGDEGECSENRVE
jgi:hypothetical protein